jgi:hypothetical protein
MVDIPSLLDQISNSDLHHNLVKWLAAYLRGRSAACNYHGKQFKFRSIHIGVPQGSVLSPLLFNYYVSNFPDLSDLKTSFADDFTAAASDPDRKVIEDALNADMKLISKWTGRKLLKISSAKSQITLFSPNTKEFKDKPQVAYDDSLIPVENTIKILGITLDTKHTFTPMCQSPNPKVAAASTSSRWSQAQFGASIRRIFSSHSRHSSPQSLVLVRLSGTPLGPGSRHQLLHYSQYRMRPSKWSLVAKRRHRSSTFMTSAKCSRSKNTWRCSAPNSWQMLCRLITHPMESSATRLLLVRL